LLFSQIFSLQSLNKEYHGLVIIYSINVSYEQM